MHKIVSAVRRWRWQLGFVQAIDIFYEEENREDSEEENTVDDVPACDL